jgi:hypothetical protein
LGISPLSEKIVEYRNKWKVIQIKLVNMSMIFTVPNFICLRATVHELSQLNEILILTVLHISIFRFSQKKSLVKSCSSLAYLPEYKSHGPMFSATISEAERPPFGMVEEARLEVWCRGGMNV